MSLSMAVRTESVGVLDCIFAAVCQSLLMMHFKVWATVAPLEWRRLTASFTYPVRA
jgi:hypothetical protein